MKIDQSMDLVSEIYRALSYPLRGLWLKIGFILLAFLGTRLQLAFTDEFTVNFPGGDELEKSGVVPGLHLTMGRYLLRIGRKRRFFTTTIQNLTN